MIYKLLKIFRFWIRYFFKRKAYFNLECDICKMSFATRIEHENYVEEFGNIYKHLYY